MTVTICDVQILDFLHQILLFYMRVSSKRHTGFYSQVSDYFEVYHT